MNKPPYNFRSWYDFYKKTQREIFMKDLDTLNAGDNLVIVLEGGTKITLGTLKMMVLDELEEAQFVEKTMAVIQAMNMPDLGQRVMELWKPFLKFRPR